MAKKMTGKELVAFCRSKIGTPYVYGMKGKIMTEQNYKFLKNTYGKMVWLSDRDKIGKVCVDCSGLISWACGVYPLGHLFPRDAGGMDGIPAASVRRQPGKSPGNAGTGFYGGAPCRSPCND